MSTQPRFHAKAASFRWWVVLGGALAYCTWLGWHWLPLDFSDKELAAFVSRLWDVKRGIAENHQLSWWTPFYMSGSSYGLHHSQGLYLVPSLLFATMFELHTAVKLTSLLAILAGTVAMYCCSRYFLFRAAPLSPTDPRAVQPIGPLMEWAACLSALAWMLHPEQIIRAAGAEHLGIIVFMPFVPLTWWTFARALDNGRFRNNFWCAVCLAGSMWAHNKMAFVNLVFFGAYFVYWLTVEQRYWPSSRTAHSNGKAVLFGAIRSCVTIGTLAALLGAFFIVPGLTEAKYVKLFEGEPILEWQKSYAFKSLLGIVDRDAAVTRDAVTTVLSEVQKRGGVRSQTELDQVLRVRSLQMDSPEKYAGLVLLALLIAAMLWNRQRIDRWLFWFFVGAFLLSVMLAYGRSNVWSGNWTTGRALFGLDSVPGNVRTAVTLGIAAVVVFVIIFYRRKLTTPRKRLLAAIALGGFLLVPAFSILSTIPFFKEIRAPYVFYDIPATFIGAMLAGFFVSDFLAPRLKKEDGRLAVWGMPLGMLITGCSLLMLIDYWPYQKPMKDNGVPTRTLQNLQATYGALRQDPDWVKTFSISGRYFHLLGPMYGGKPQVYEAFYNWMCPKGTALLNQYGGGSQELLNLLAARYLIYDKTDPSNASPQMQQLLASYRQILPAALENEDFVVFRNTAAHHYLSAYSSACLFVGDVEFSPQLSLILGSRTWPLVHSIERDLKDIPVESLRQFERIYVAGSDFSSVSRMPPELQLRVSLLRSGENPILPARMGSPVALTEVNLIRDQPDVIQARFTAPASCTIVLAESYYPFWTATLNGKPVELQRVSTGLMGLSVPNGAHQVELQYRVPLAYRGAAGCSLLTILAAGVGLIKGRKS